MTFTVTMTRSCLLKILALTLRYNISERTRIMKVIIRDVWKRWKKDDGRKSFYYMIKLLSLCERRQSSNVAYKPVRSNIHYIGPNE